MDILVRLFGNYQLSEPMSPVPGAAPQRIAELI
jgi:hypothetical protein